MEHNGKHFALQLGALISLYVSIGGLISLLFGAITMAFPDPANTWEYESAQGAIRWAIALVVVFFPTYLILTRIINQSRRTTGAPYLSLTKWLIYLSLLVGGVVILGDLVAIIYNFLNGELTTRFLLKAVTLLVVVGLAFVYYLYDARGYWQTHETRSKQYALVALLVVILSVVLGYMYIDKPTDVREKRLDDRQITDLTTIQSFIESEYSLTGSLPTSLSDLGDRVTIPEAPEGRDAYVYKKTSERSFELCATFANPSDQNMMHGGWPSEVGIKNPYDWNHKEGKTCFPRVMNEPTNIVPKPIM